MAQLNLIQYIKCKNAVSLKNLQLKVQINKAIDTLVISTKSYVTSVIKGVEGQIGSAIDYANQAIKDTETALKDLQEGIKGQYDTSVKLINDRIDTVKGYFNTTCPDADAVSINNINKPATNPIGELYSIPPSYDPALTFTEDAQLIKNIRQSDNMVASSPLLGKALAIGQLNNKLDTKGVYETREYVRLMKNLHPIIDTYVNTLTYFQPISEDVGASFLAYTLDKTALPLEKWINPTPNYTPIAVRKNVNLKLRVDINNEIEQSYVKLTQDFASNISTEFLTERSQTIGSANAYHIMGDYAYYNDHLLIDGTLVKTVLQTLINTAPNFQNLVSLINYLTPILPNLNIVNDVYETTVEGYTTLVDKRNNKVVNPFTSINNNALNPMKRLEE